MLIWNLLVKYAKCKNSEKHKIVSCKNRTIFSNEMWPIPMCLGRHCIRLNSCMQLSLTMKIAVYILTITLSSFKANVIVL